MTAADPAEQPVALPAMQALLDFAAVTRPDIDRGDLEGALLACGTAGWTWSRTLVAAAQILAHGEAPHDLRTATRDPLKKHLRTST